MSCYVPVVNSIQIQAVATNLQIQNCNRALTAIFDFHSSEICRKECLSEIALVSVQIFCVDMCSNAQVQYVEINVTN